MGLDEGRGGGVFPFTPFTPLDVLRPWLLILFAPLDNVDPGGIFGGSRGGSLLVGGGFANSCVGVLDGRGGVGSVWRTSCTDTTLGVDFADFKGILTFSTS